MYFAFVQLNLLESPIEQKEGSRVRTNTCLIKGEKKLRHKLAGKSLVSPK